MQDWVEESNSGFQKSSLSSQCNFRYSSFKVSLWYNNYIWYMILLFNFRYKIYAEGFAWSVSLKYILSCGSLVLIIDPQYEDFFTRGLVPKENFWPISPTELCRSIKLAVDWGNSNPSEVLLSTFPVILYCPYASPVVLSSTFSVQLHKIPSVTQFRCIFPIRAISH